MAAGDEAGREGAGRKGPGDTHVRRPAPGRRQATDRTAVLGTPAGQAAEAGGPTPAAAPGRAGDTLVGPRGSTPPAAQERVSLRGMGTPIALPPLPGHRPFDAASAPREGKYLLGAELGSGGMGRVLVARDTELGRHVALKTLHEEHARDARMVRALLFEARVTGQLEHPNIVPVHDVGVLSDGRAFYAMKLVGGLTLKDILAQLRDDVGFARETYTPTRLLQYFRGVCMAVEYAHARGVVHRDIKPDNVLVGEFGEVHIMDWGIARVLPAEPGRPGLFAGAEEEPGLIAGTPHYMSPEQARGETHLLDARSDVYSLGVLLYQLLTWTLPFDTTTTEQQLDALLTLPVPPPRERAPARDIPPELERICLRALERDRAARYPSALAVWTDIEAWLDRQKERERLQRLADAQVAEAEALARRYGEERARVQGLEAEVRRDELAAGYYDPLAVRRAAWDRHLALEHLRLVEARTFAEAVSRYHQALAHRPEHARALDGLAALYRGKADDARRRGDAATMVLYGDLARAITARGAPAAPATLHIRSYPAGAAVSIHALGGAEGPLEPGRARQLGPAPCLDLRLEPGTWLLCARLPGFRESRLPVVLEPGATERVLVTLRPWSDVTPLIGHADELTAIREAFTTTVAEGRLTAMLVCGEAGLGKGKLLAEFDRYLDELPDLVTFGYVRCEPLHRHVPFRAAVDILRHRFGIAPLDPPDIVRARLAHGVQHILQRKGHAAGDPADAGRVARAVDRLGSLPGLLDGHVAHPAGPAWTREVFEAAAWVFGELADLDPIVLVVRGADHLDRLSAAFLADLAVRLEDKPIFCLLLARAPELSGLSFHRVARLRPLDREGVHHQLSILLKGPAAPDLAEAIHARSGGNPFLVDQIARLLVTRRWLEQGSRHWHLVDAPEARRALMQLPPAELALAPIRDDVPELLGTLEAAAVCGHGFWDGQVAAVAGHPVEDALAALVEHEVVAHQPATRFPGHQTYAFRHHGVREALLARLDDARRREGHRRAAAWLQAAMGDDLEDAARVALHLERAGRPEEARPWRERLAAAAAPWEAPDAPPWPG